MRSFSRLSVPQMRRTRGGALFTMVLFLLLLVTSGLMYFYFMKARMLERELEQWRAGVKVQETTKLVKTYESPAPAAQMPAPDATATPIPAPPMPASMPDGELPAPPMARNTPPPAAPRVPAVSDEVLPGLGESKRDVAPSNVAEPATAVPRSTPRPRASATPTDEAAPTAHPPVRPIRSAYDLAGPQETVPPTPAPTVRVPRRPAQTPGAGRTRQPDAIGDILLGRDSNEIQD